MLSLQQLRKLDSSLNNLSDNEVEALREDFYNMAQIAFDVWWEQKDGSKNPVRLSPEL